MIAKDHQKASGSPKVEVGEIDTRAPFQSVKDAVTLFGEGTFSGEKPAIRKVKPYYAERALAKETQLHLAEKELNKLKEQVKIAETTNAQALAELEKARITVDDLNHKLSTVSQSKELAVNSTEESKNKAEKLAEGNVGSADAVLGSWKEELEYAREHYVTKITELDAAKQELTKIRQDSDASLGVKVAALKQAAEAEVAAKANTERASEISKEISSIHESVEQVMLACSQAQQEQAKIAAEKDVQKHLYKGKLEETSKKVLALKKELDPELIKHLEGELADTVSKIETLQKETENTKASDLDSVQTVTSELDDAKDFLQKVAEEENSLKGLLESLKLKLEDTKKEHLELKEKEAETESIASNLHFDLRKSKSELEALLAEESKIRGASNDMILTLKQLSLETDNTRLEAEEMKEKAKELMKEAEVARITLKEAENNLGVALQEAEEAKSAELEVLNQIKLLSERTTAARASTSDSGANITISKDEFDSLSRKVGESDILAEMKVAAAMAQVEAVKAGENEALKKLEVTQKEIEDMKAATVEALKRAEMAEAAKKAVEGELRRWREREQKKAAEVASKILAQTEMSSDSSPHHYRIHKQNPTEKILEARRLEKEKMSVSKRALLPNLSGIFHRKKNPGEGVGSYLPGEKPV